MPKSLRKELEAHWNTAHPELAAAVHQRQLDYEKGVQPLKEAKAQLDEILNEFKPYEWLMRNENVTPKAAINELMRVAGLFRTGTPVQKAQAIAHFMQQFSIPFEHVQRMLGSSLPANGQPQTADPRLNPLVEHLQQMNHTVTTLQQQWQQQSEARALSAIQQFATTHPEFDAVSERMLTLLQSPQILGVDASAGEQERLQAAYDMACRLDPAVQARIEAAKASAQQAHQKVTQSKAAAVQVRGAPASGPQPAVNPQDRRALIKNAMSRASG